MKLKYLPDYLAKDIYSVPTSFYKEQGIKNLLIDLDNTLAPYYEKDPSASTKAFIDKLKNEGFKVFIASNNTGKRVKRFSRSLQVPCASSLRKPFAFKLKKLLIRYNLKRDETLLLGDQVYTDVPTGKKSGIRVLLFHPLVEKDQIFTYFNRKREKKARKYLEELNIPRIGGFNY